MQRRQVLKLILPLTLFAAGALGTVFGRKLLHKTDCTTGEPAMLLSRLKPFSDAELGKKAGAEIVGANLHHLQALCESGFDQQYRLLVQGDFIEHRTHKVDGWILSQTEVITHHVVQNPVYLSGVQPAGG